MSSVIPSLYMSRRFLPVALLSLFAPLASLPAQTAETIPPPPTPVRNPEFTLREAVARALEKNFTLQVQNFSTETAALAIDIAEADYSPELGLTARTGVTQAAAAGSTLDGVTQEGPRQDYTNISASVTQKVTTGASVTGSTNLDRSETNSRNTLLNPAYDSDVSLQVSQPLLRGFGPDYNKAAIARARLGVERANYDFKGTVLDVVRDVEVAYYNLVFAREQLDVRRFSLSVAEQLLEENKARKDTGVATDLDVLQAQVGVANANRALIEAQRVAQDREDALLDLISQFEFSSGVGTVGVPDLVIPDVSFDHSYKLARDNWPAYASQLAAIEQLDIDVRTARSNRLPSLDLGGAVGYNAKEADADAATRNVWDGEGYSWQVNLSLRVPWGFKEEKARLGTARASLAREETRLRQIEQTVMVQVRAAVRSVEANEESVRISTLATELSERQFELEKARFDAGLSTFRRVQESQEDLDAARVNELQARVNLRIALAQLARLEASSLPRYSIVLE